MIDRSQRILRLSIFPLAVSLVFIVGCLGDADGEVEQPSPTPPPAEIRVSTTPQSAIPSVQATQPSLTTVAPESSIQVPATEPTAQILPTPTAADTGQATATPFASPVSGTPSATPTLTIGTNATTTTVPIEISTPQPTATSIPPQTVLPTPSPTPTQIPPSPTPTGPTPTPFIPPTAVPTTVPSPTPVRTADARFGLIVGGRDNSEAAYFANALSVDWYLDYGVSPSVDPSINKLRAIMLEPGFHPYSDAEIIDLVSADPGSYFQIGNEPNIFCKDPVTSCTGVNSPAGYADALNYYATRIKAADPTAVIVGPNVLNFDFTCIGCSGYTSGRTWIEEMRQSYLSSYGTEPPIDIWAIHQYPLDWFNLPTVNDAVLTQDLEAFRTYLDSIPGQSSKEIWITEFGLHWGFEGLQYQKDGTLEPCDPSTTDRCWPGPTGEYLTSEVIGYLDRLTSFYRTNSSRLKLTRWFLWRHNYTFGPNPSGTNGLTLFDSFYQGGQLTPVGTAYRNMIFGG